MESTPWAFDRPITSPFAQPRGLAGRLAGLFMLLTNEQRELVALIDAGEGDHVLEVGYGPGGLVRELAKGPSARICGVDPSPDMRDLAGRRHRADRRVDLRIGAADAIGFGDGVFDRVVSVNNVALWPDLGAGLKEFRRVLRPGGRVVIAWHGGSAPGRIARKLTLPEDKLAMIADALGERFADVTRHELTTLTVFTGMSV
ncbi:class I SAM-dependent methyltransferase [Nonomuraea dietziae]|uniref:SAM-dependent methyltransferase n=1 Tax=Nonomuraea dietziae TaxID=65515 RepID=A0A7W5YM05_9ACTN|nr:methyltransferase domain-containing protein [Nonomuraea dietziae]MBB3725782.1 SAM-dependent methyltransferase [Nonomuraea dietziae]